MATWNKRLTAGINVYNDIEGLERCLQSIHEHMDKIFVIDGKYPDWGEPDDPPYSIDGTAELCQQYPNVLYHKLAAVQHVKRSKYLELAEGYDFLLVIDADEWVISKGDYAADWDRFRVKLETDARFEWRLQKQVGYTHNIAFLVEPGRINYFGKLIYKPSQLYYGDHWKLYRKTDRYFQKYQSMGDPDSVRGIVMTGDENKRKHQPERLQIDMDYQWLLNYKEGRIDEAEFKNKELKAKFVQHNIHELEVWKDVERD